jgi:formyltetrahydrofolate-dependent phosphoribosylglycinamide formyltransferase
LEVIIRIAVLASGAGTNLQSLIDAPDLGGEIALVVSDRPGVAALDRAESAGIPAKVVPWEGFDSRAAFSDAVGDEVDRAGAGCVVLAGFMRVLAPSMVSRFRNRMLNIHPSLLPSFPGSNAVGQALEHGVKLTGVTIHFVDEEVDHGPIIAQRAVPVFPDDDEDTLHRRIQVEEHALYPDVVRAFIRGEIEVGDGKVRWS